MQISLILDFLTENELFPGYTAQSDTFVSDILIMESFVSWEEKEDSTKLAYIII